MLTHHSLRPSFEAGRAEARRSSGSWLALGLLIVALGASSSVAMIMLAAPFVGGPMIESPVPDGAWFFEWGRSSMPPSVEQQDQVRALRAVGAGSGALISILCALSILGLWQQRLLLRRDESFVHWAVGARRLHVAARLLGEAQAPIGVAIGVALTGAAATAAFIDASFPGAASVPPVVATVAIVLAALTVVLCRWEAAAGSHARDWEWSRLRDVAGSSSVLGAIGLAALTGMGLLAVHAPDRQPVSASGGSVASVSLSGLAPSERGDRIAEWSTLARDAGVQLGFASAGTLRATGRRDRATVECGECSEGTLYMPLKIVSAEIFAVAPDTFALLGMTVEYGRDFDDAIDRGPPSVVIVARAMANRHFQDGEPLGRRLRVGESDWLTVVGVVDALGPEPRGGDSYAIYLPLAQARPPDIEVLTDGSPAALATVLDRAPPGTVSGAARPSSDVFATHRWFRRLLNVMGMATLVLTGAGLWISAANEAGAVRYEIGVRRAVGATRRSLWAFHARFTSRRLVVVVVLGAWLSLFLGAGLEQAFPSIPRLDWRIWLGAATWISMAYVLGSLPRMVRASRASLTDALEGST